MNSQANSGHGNILGAARAEVDSLMLERAFLETSEFQALKETDHFSFVVGRRGTGKTAFYLQLVKEFVRDRRLFCYRPKSEEHDARLLLSVFNRLGINAYSAIRPTTRVLWRTSMLMSVAENLCQHWKYKTSPEAQWLQNYVYERKGFLAHNELQRCVELVRQVSVDNPSADEIPGRVATTYQLNALEKEIRDGLESVESKVIFLFDGLDEGWTPDEGPTALIGGLAIAVADFGDRKVPIQGKVFIRDNMFRMLAALDSDFSRHIEGNTLRLSWAQDSLLSLVANRLRVVLDVPMENNIRVWNRFARRGIKDRRGFEHCLQHTLYRPRDLLVLLNEAAVRAAREGREGIIDADIEGTSRQISSDRLTDLLKEYEGVFPGLSLIVNSFTGHQACQSLESVKSLLDDCIQHETFDSPEASDIAVLGTGSQIIDALFGIGFLGLEDPTTGMFQFSHDGTSSTNLLSLDKRRIAIHPCYWRALDVTNTDLPAEIQVEIHDDYAPHANRAVSELRTRRLGRLVSDLPDCPEGREGAHKFEEWVLTACQILFAGHLRNFVLHPASEAVQQRDVVATNQADSGFWKRVLNDYSCRQVIFEIKNVPVLTLDNFRQAVTYSGNQYGKLVFIVHRVDNEKMDRVVRSWIKEMWDQHRVIIVTLPTAIIIRCLKKIRSPRRRDYVDEVLSRRLDTFERNYLSLHHSKIRGRRRK